MYKILIVDDESIEREGISFLIEKYKLPLEIAQATNGKTALEYMRTHPIDILLTDVKMPQMDGLELARHTFEKYPDVRILVFSAYGEFEFAKKAMAAQAVSYLLKPIEVDEFQRVMAQILARCDELAEKKKDEQQRGEEYRQQLLFRLVTGTGLGKAHITEEWFSGQTLCLLHVQTENDYFATNEDAFCQMLKDCTQYKFEYINTYPDEAFVLFYSKYDLSDRLGDKLKDIQEKLRQNGCEASLLLGIDFTGLENISARAQALSRIRNELYEAPDALLLEKEIGESVSYYAEAIEKLRAEVQAALNEHHPEIFLSAVQRLIQQLGQNRSLSKMYMVNIVSSRFRHGPKTEERAIDEAMQKVISEKYLMLPLYLYDHSGLAMSTESFSGRAPHAEWDSGQVGWIYVSKEDALKEFDADKMTGAIRQKADALMRSEVAAYDSYLHGECYGFELYKNGELSDSCWGFMGNFSDVLKDMAEYLPDECKGMVDHLEEQERPATIIKTLLKHAKIQVDQAAKAFEHASRQQVLGESR